MRLPKKESGLPNMGGGACAPGPSHPHRMQRQARENVWLLRRQPRVTVDHGSSVAAAAEDLWSCAWQDHSQDPAPRMLSLSECSFGASARATPLVGKEV